jgi:ribonucleoside-diphosphate reductase alpha chain
MSLNHLINPAYITSANKAKSNLIELDYVRNTKKFYKFYADSLELLHREFYTQVKKAQDISLWPEFSLKKIKLFDGETLTDLLLANAIVLAQEFIKLSPNTDLKTKVFSYYNELASKRISLASPFFNNLRRAGERNLSSCFIMEVNDSLESIMKHLTYCARISKAGGGAGVYMGLLRGKGANIGSNKNASSSVMAWIRLFDQVCVSVNQLGHRPGAITVALPIWHIDIEEFLDCQTENGDLRAKAYNIQPQVCIDDKFMHAVIDNQSYALYCPKDLCDANINPSKDTNWHVRAEKIGLIKKEINARKLWAVIQERQLTLGRPYIFFTDNAQINTPFKNYGNINCSNLCVESFSYFEVDNYIHCCNLISINLAEHDSLKSIEDSTKIATEMADLSLNLSSINIPEAQKHIKDFRTIGIGMMGLADWLAKNESYYSDLALIEKTQKTITLAAYRRSIELAYKWGSCAAELSLVSQLWDTLDKEPDSEFWKQMRSMHGIRNAMFLATAPNTSTSLVMGATASFLPPYSLNFIDESEDHSLQVITKYKPELYLTNQEINQRFITDCTAVMQKWTDAGISMEYILPKGASWSSNKSFSDNKIAAWKEKIKAVYYVRSTTAEVIPSCNMCAN